MAKRLRGWQLEHQSGRRPASKAICLEKENVPQSALANKLLGLWAQGILSATLIREIADLALQDGANHSDLQSLAQAAQWQLPQRPDVNFLLQHLAAQPIQNQSPLLGPKNFFGKGRHGADFFATPGVLKFVWAPPPSLPWSFQPWKREFGQVLEGCGRLRGWQASGSPHVLGKALAIQGSPTVHTWWWCWIPQPRHPPSVQLGLHSGPEEFFEPALVASQLPKSCTLENTLEMAGVVFQSPWKRASPKHWPWWQALGKG